MGALPPAPPSPPPMVLADDGDEELAPLQLPSPASFEQVTVRVRTEATELVHLQSAWAAAVLAIERIDKKASVLDVPREITGRLCEIKTPVRL